MKFANTSGFLLSVGRCKIKPYSVTRDFSEKEMADSKELERHRSKGILVEYKDGDNLPTPKAKSNQPDPRFDVDEDFKTGKLVTKQTGKGQPVQYVVASAEGADSVAMDDDTVTTSFGKEVHKSPDFIQTGVDASKFKNGALAIEQELNKESNEAQYDDEDTLVEGERGQAEVLDLDKSEEVDMSGIVHKQGKFGAVVTDAKTLMQTSMTSELNKVAQEISKGLDEEEHVDPSHTTVQVAEFLEKPLNAKKFIIAKETDTAFLKEVGSVSQSQTLKQLVKQRVSELK